MAFFLYNEIGDDMKVYIDLLLLLNLIYDALILITVDLALKRRMKFKRILLGSFIGMLSTLIIFLKISNIFYLLLELLASLIMVLVTFGYKGRKYLLENIIYLYMVSVILAGFINLLKNHLANINYLLLLIIAPSILGMYVYEQKKLKETVNYIKEVTIVLKNNQILNLNGFIDTGNRLKDPITKKNIILINKKKLEGIYNIRSPMYVPIKTVNKKSLLECISIKDLIIEDIHFNNRYLLGLTDYLKENSDCLLHYKILEEL